MPPKHRGAISGLATTTKGVGLIVGPLLAGGAKDLASPYLHATDGYQIIWPACGIPILAVIPLVAHLARVEAAASGKDPRGS
jgi:MFS family permease